MQRIIIIDDGSGVQKEGYFVPQGEVQESVADSHLADHIKKQNFKENLYMTFLVVSTVTAFVSIYLGLRRIKKAS